MAALTATGTVHIVVAGNRRVRLVQVPAASNGDTYTTDLTTIDAVTCVPNDASTVAADSCSATSSGSVITFNVAGTARAQQLVIWGRL
jgi:hypothetical protein